MYDITHKYSKVCTHGALLAIILIEFLKMVKIPNYLSATIIIIPILYNITIIVH